MGKLVEVSESNSNIRNGNEVRAVLLFSNGNVVPLSRFPMIIGRTDFIDSMPSDILHYVSRQHFCLRYENGQHAIQDLNSTNGTKINGVEIKGKERWPLKNGDRIEIAEVMALTFCLNMNNSLLTT